MSALWDQPWTRPSRSKACTKSCSANACTKAELIDTNCGQTTPRSCPQKLSRFL
ncbi:hypothetical protein DIPPA_05279 [Diplonema papillatum]|nr:hypothetical protein DIPPA_05279 [Diplonema papillatum]